MRKRANYKMVDEHDPHFAAFWDAYPKHVAKKDARKAWAEINPDAITATKIIAALEWQREQPAWVKDDGQYVPYPASWLRAERWTDEPSRTGPGGGTPPPPKSLAGIHAWMLKRAAGN